MASGSSPAAGNDRRAPLLNETVMVNDKLMPPHVESDNAAITLAVDKLRALSQRSHQGEWRLSPSALSLSEVLAQQPWSDWPIAPLNGKNHIAWPQGQQPLWLCQSITIPAALAGFPLSGLSLCLGLTWWAEAIAIYVDGHLVQEGDLFDYFARIPLSHCVKAGQTFAIALRLTSPGHDAGALVRSQAIYESLQPDQPEPGFVADELAVLQTYAQQLNPDYLADIAAAIAPLDWSAVCDQGHFLRELTDLRDRLQPLSAWLKQRQITCVGHAHLDLAWLWPVADTWQAAERTFRSVLALQTDFPDMTYTHSSPALFDSLETHQPELFHTVQTAVKQGAWSIDAGLWVEPELNTLGGESLARQILYGQRYSRSRFGDESAIAWLPDCFGFSWQLPQLLSLGGIQYFATQKLRWNESTPFPHSFFWWEGQDGTRLLSLTLPPIGTDVDAPQMAFHSAVWEYQTGLADMLWLPGMGDHGGGPTRDMLERAQRWQASPFFPRLEFDSPFNHLQRLTAAVATNTIDAGTSLVQHDRSDGPRKASVGSESGAAAKPLPVWKDELYLELHRGCYTVHADQKWYNRRCEDALREAELFAAIAQMHSGSPYPQAALETAWKQVLFNQFHDILPGTAIPEVFATVNPEWQAAYSTAKAVRENALKAIAQTLPQLSPPVPEALPLLVFNSLNWPQTQLVEVALSTLPTPSTQWRVWDAATGQALTTQISQRDSLDYVPGQSYDPPVPESCLLFSAVVPPVGYRLYWLLPGATDHPDVVDEEHQLSLRLTNDHIRVEVDPQTGDLMGISDRQSQNNWVRSPANQLQTFADAGQYWDAWDIAPDYQDHPLPPATLQAIEWIERGPLRQRLRVIRDIAESRIQQDYVLDQTLPYLKVVTRVEWRATQVVLKVAFPLTIEAPVATYEIPFGAIARPTAPTDPHDQAKWEVPAYRWADLSTPAGGLSILTDYKHGFDALPDQLRLTLLKAPLWPDPQADRGCHQFTYGLYPHEGDWRASKTPQQAIAFNTPFQVVVGQAMAAATANAAPTEQSSEDYSQQSFLDLGTDCVQLAALKQAEDDPDQYILRVCELYGEAVTLTVPATAVVRTNLLERAIATETPLHLQPWQIATFKLAHLSKSP
ncbi:MAG: alpha-mannosidase [Leptolyngbyaceae cyanobacterium]